MGVLTAKEYFIKEGQISITEPVFTGKAPETMSKELDQKKGQVSNVIKEYSWKMVFAKNQAEFDQLYDEMLVKAKGLGYNDVLRWNIEQAKKIAEWRKSNN